MNSGTMNRIGTIGGIVYALLFSTMSAPAQENPVEHAGLTVLKGSYLGQKPPGMIPEIFAKEIISGECTIHGCPVFSPDGSELYWGPMDGAGCSGKTDEILFMKRIDNMWSGPEVVSFSSMFWDSDDPCMAPDGKRIYFTTHRPSGLLKFDFGEKIMFVERTADGWSSTKSVGKKVNSMFRHWQLSVTKDYDIYFHAEKNVQQPGIYVSRYVEGEYQTPERLPSEVNTGNPTSPFIAPDESYLIFVKTTRANGDDLFISFRDSSGVWSRSESLGDEINSSSHDYCPNVTPDGKYLFFISQRDGRNYSYWVSAAVIDAAKKRIEAGVARTSVRVSGHGG